MLPPQKTAAPPGHLAGSLRGEANQKFCVPENRGEQSEQRADARRDVKKDEGERLLLRRERHGRAPTLVAADRGGSGCRRGSVPEFIIDVSHASGVPLERHRVLS